VKPNLDVRNRQRGREVNVRQLRRIVRTLVVEVLDHPHFDVGVYLLGQAAMTRLNEEQLGHSGATDVITFDYQLPELSNWLGGEIFVCVPVAVEQASEFRTTWQEEIVRYIVHGLLHLEGYDDHRPVDRARMKRQEAKVLRRLAELYRLRSIGRA
jgi:rRNA maturation RNase YbeY